MIKGKWMDFRSGNVTNSYSAYSNPGSKAFSSWKSVRAYVDWVKSNNPNIEITWR